jgi:hypothetical protein
LETLAGKAPSSKLQAPSSKLQAPSSTFFRALLLCRHALTIRHIFGFLFVGTAIAKFAYPFATLAVLQGVWGFSESSSKLVFNVLLVIEVGLGIGLMASSVGIIDLLVVSFLMIVSTSPFRQLLEQNQLSCGCGFNASFVPPRAQQLMSIFFNLAIIAALLLAWPSSPGAASSSSRRTYA